MWPDRNAPICRCLVHAHADERSLSPVSERPTKPVTRGTDGNQVTSQSLRIGGPMWRCLTAVCTLALLVACSSGSDQGGRSNHDSPTAHTGEHETHTVRDAPACFQPRTTAILSDRKRTVRRSARKPVRVSLRVGSTFVVRSFGACARDVTTSPQNGRVRIRRSKYGWGLRTTTFVAARPGRVRLIVAMPMCAQMDRSSGSACVGGIVFLGTILLHVETRAQS